MTKKILILAISIFCITTAYSQKWTSYSKATSSLISDNVKTIFIDDKGIKWIGTDIGLCSFDGVKWTTHTIAWTAYKSGDFSINAISQHKTKDKSELWVATNSGLTVLDITTYNNIPVPTTVNQSNSGIASDTVKAVSMDTIADIKWFGTPKGVSAQITNLWKQYDEAGYLLRHPIVQIASASTGWNYIATSDAGVVRVKHDVDGFSGATIFDDMWSGLPSNNINDIFINQEGHQLYGTQGGAAYHFGWETKRNWTQFLADEGIISEIVKAVAQDTAKGFWFGTDKGVSHYNGKIWRNYTEAEGLISNTIHDIAIDLDGSLWFATNKGISHLTGTYSSIDNDYLPKKYNSLNLSISPNPVSNYATIQFNLPGSTHVTLNLCDIHGRMIKELINRYCMVGENAHEINFNAITSNPLPAGLYLLYIHAGNDSATRKLILIK